MSQSEVSRKSVLDRRNSTDAGLEIIVSLLDQGPIN